MKLYIKNNSILSFKKIGELFDDYYRKIIQNKHNIDIGQIEIFSVDKKEYRMIIKKTKTRINLIIDSLELEPKKVDMSDKTFPEIPKRRKEKINERENN